MIPEWEIKHHGHFAWFQRSLLPGDFKPGLTPNSFYIVDKDGRAADPFEVPKCETCGEVPEVNDLEPTDPSTLVAGFLDRFRRKIQPHPWPAPSNPKGCWFCGTKGPTVSGSPRICRQCEQHLRTSK